MNHHIINRRCPVVIEPNHKSQMVVTIHLEPSYVSVRQLFDIAFFERPRDFIILLIYRLASTPHTSPNIPPWVYSIACPVRHAPRFIRTRSAFLRLAARSPLAGKAKGFSCQWTSRSTEWPKKKKNVQHGQHHYRYPHKIDNSLPGRCRTN